MERESELRYLSGQEIKSMGKEIIIIVSSLTRRELIPTVTICHRWRTFWFMIQSRSRHVLKESELCLMRIIIPEGWLFTGASEQIISGILTMNIP